MNNRNHHKSTVSNHNYSKSFFSEYLTLIWVVWFIYGCVCVCVCQPVGCEVWCRSIALSHSPAFSPTGPSVTFSPTGGRLVNYHWSFHPHPCCHHFINPILISSDLDCLLSLTGEWPAFSLTLCQTVLSCSQYICQPQNHGLSANGIRR